MALSFLPPAGLCVLSLSSGSWNTGSCVQQKLRMRQLGMPQLGMATHCWGCSKQKGPPRNRGDLSMCRETGSSRKQWLRQADKYKSRGVA